MIIRFQSVVGAVGAAGDHVLAPVALMVSNGVFDHLLCHQFMVYQSDVKVFPRKVDDVEPQSVHFVMTMKA